METRKEGEAAALSREVIRGDGGAEDPALGVRFPDPLRETDPWFRRVELGGEEPGERPGDVTPV